MDTGYHSANKIRNTYKNRLFALTFIFVITIMIYGGYLFRLQIVQGGEYKSRAQSVSRRIIPIQAQRGEIFDRNYNEPLVTNRDSFAVDIIPAELDSEKRETVAKKLSEVLTISAEDVLSKIPVNYSSYHQPVEIQGGVDFSKISYIAEHIEQFPGVTWHSKPVRQYHNIGSLSHAIGYVGSITSEELRVKYNEGYGFNSIIGKSGIEKQYDKILRGENGRRFLTVDAHGRSMDGEITEEIPPENGLNLTLTIDRDIQKLAEEALGERIGSAIVLKPATGEILAMVSYPWYDPNIFNSSNLIGNFSRLSLDSKYPFINRTIQSSYAPASVFKIVMSSAAYEEEAIPPDKTILCEGSLRVGNRVFNCHKKEGHGHVNLSHGLAESCDVYYYTLGLNYLGIDTIYRYTKNYGFGEYTGIDLPGEIKGQVPNPEWKKQNLNSQWVGGDTVNMSIGQGYLAVTPIQMANMIAMTVNGGEIYRPHLVKEMRNSITGGVEETIEPEILRSSNMRKETFEKVQEDMRGVVKNGTAEVAITTDAVDIAGKTGTGEVGYEDRWTAWFGANAPYGAPPEEQIVVVTMVEAENEWEWWAIRAANIIFQGIFADQTYDEAIEELDWGWLHNDRVTQ
ncbi:MAG: penicillin-binding protein 2 [Spirochaetia bacterium]